MTDFNFEVSSSPIGSQKDANNNLAVQQLLGSSNSSTSSSKTDNSSSNIVKVSNDNNNNNNSTPNTQRNNTSRYSHFNEKVPAKQTSQQYGSGKYKDQEYSSMSLSKSQRLLRWFMTPWYAIRNPTQRLPSVYGHPFLIYIDDYFSITSLHSDISTEIIGGMTNFLCTSYILLLQPTLLASIGLDPSGVFFSTVLICALGTLSMGIINGVPLVIAPSMGDNYFFVYTLIGIYGISPSTACGLGLIVSSIEFLVVFLGIRANLISAIYEQFRLGIAVGIGLFLGLLGLLNSGIVVIDKTVTISATAFAFDTASGITWQAALSLVTVIFMSGLMIRQIRFAFILPIVLASIIVCSVTAIQGKFVLGEFGVWNTSTLLQLDFGFQTAHILWLIPVMILSRLLDSTATILTVLRNVYFENPKNPSAVTGSNLKSAEKIELTWKVSVKVRRILLVDSFFGIVSAILGNSVSTPFIESATGVAIGARTGLASVISGFLFLLAIPLGPIYYHISPQGTGAALILTATILLTYLKHMDFNREFSRILPALVCIFAIPFTMSIQNGAALGYAMHLSWIIGGRLKKITMPMAVLTLLSLFHICAKLFILI